MVVFFESGFVVRGRVVGKKGGRSGDGCPRTVGGGKVVSGRIAGEGGGRETTS